MKKVTIYTDGACSGNPGAGGWAAILMYNGHTREVSGYDKQTTNNRMELFAVIQSLRSLKEPCETEIYTDSAYVADAFNKGWVNEWQANGWKTASKQNVRNVDLWKALIYEINKNEVTFIKVKGHADNPYNNRCDELARAAIKTAGKS